MRRVIRVLLISALTSAACGGATEPNGSVQLSVAARCAFSATQIWDVYLDLKPLGSVEIGPGQSHTFGGIAAGTHAVEALRQNGLGTFRYDWPSVVVSGSATAPLVIDCPPLG